MVYKMPNHGVLESKMFASGFTKNFRKFFELFKKRADWKWIISWHHTSNNHTQNQNATATTTAYTQDKKILYDWIQISKYYRNTNSTENVICTKDIVGSSVIHCLLHHPTKQIFKSNLDVIPLLSQSFIFVNKTVSKILVSSIYELCKYQIDEPGGWVIWLHYNDLWLAYQ